MAQDEGKDYAKLFRDAAVPHVLIEQWERMKTFTEQMRANMEQRKIESDKSIKEFKKLSSVFSSINAQEEIEKLKFENSVAHKQLNETLEKQEHALQEMLDQMLAYVQEKKGWLDAGMPLAKPLKITSKPLKFNKI